MKYLAAFRLFTCGLLVWFVTSTSAQNAPPVTLRNTSVTSASDTPNGAKKQPVSSSKVEKQSKKDPTISEAQINDWQTRVLMPLSLLAGVVVVLASLFKFLDLPSFLTRESWNERTVLAMAIVFTFCVASVLDINNSVLQMLKDMALVVIGFYFGSAKTLPPASQSNLQPRPSETKQPQ